MPLLNQIIRCNIIRRKFSLNSTESKNDKNATVLNNKKCITILLEMFFLTVVTVVYIPVVSF